MFPKLNLYPGIALPRNNVWIGLPDAAARPTIVVSPMGITAYDKRAEPCRGRHSTCFRRMLTQAPHPGPSPLPKESSVTKTVSKIARSKNPADKSDRNTPNGVRSANPYFGENSLGDEEFESEERGTDDRPVDAEEDLDVDIDMETDPESAAGPVTGDDDQIDDPIRIYLMQMGEIPLLSRAEEIVAARQIKRARRRFRHIMLATDYVLHAAIEMLKSIRDGHSRLDRTIEVSVINIREKKRLTKVLAPNLQTLDHSGGRTAATSPRRSASSRPDEAAPRGLAAAVARRGRAVRLIEELGLRTQRLQPILDKLKQISRQMDDLHAQIRQLQGPAGG